ncbi:GNAT family N-acetyltransferase [Deinococcus cellulosilyticus]|uniref:N-acetyltransferase n=1 Tax=Deinococcus cellulosilyticus (strain DSM 18568 / NBRC 106333 / KACC 11606 / 5516J-15) TaxID=1223518 RepID=A0A511N6U5_DEIC1|nr:GNAT family protein [Deinococcus cellulosilyticus]GEM48569.1 N-acetyltransferase [Deinococcus cellulosilyticus NBRC 106333 = KACC 11606]
MNPVLFRGKKVMLGVLERTDIPDIASHFQNPGMTLYMYGYGKTFSLEEEYQWYDSTISNPDNVTFGILTLEGTVMGSCSLFDINHRMGTATFGICIWKPDFWSKGYGTEATRLMVEYGMFHLNLYNIDLTVYSFNPRGIQAYLKAGFREVGRRRGAALLGHERFDRVWMEITRDEVDLSGMRAMVPLLESGPRD